MSEQQNVFVIAEDSPIIILHEEQSITESTDEGATQSLETQSQAIESLDRSIQQLSGTRSDIATNPPDLSVQQVSGTASDIAIEPLDACAQQVSGTKCDTGSKSTTGIESSDPTTNRTEFTLEAGSTEAHIMPVPSPKLTKTRPYQQTEILIQYGHLEEDLQQLAIATNLQHERQQEFGLAMMFGTAVPFVTIETFYAIFKIFAPNTMIDVAKVFSSLSHGNEFYFEQFHGLLYAFLGPVIILALLIFNLYRLHALGPWGPFSPTHIGLLRAGIRRHWKSLFLSWSPSIRPWSNVTSVEYSEYGRKKQRKRITLRFAKDPIPLSIEVTAIRRMPEKEALANALRFFLPAHVQGDLKQLLDKTLPKQNRYTEIWTQALLNRPQRLLLTALTPQTVLHDGLYTVTEQIGAGGQGTAYLASATGLIPEVVLKEYVLPDHNNVHDRRRALKRLEDEVQILSRLSHPQIVKLHDVFIEDHRAYLVLDYIDGPSLKSIVARDTKFEVNQTLELAMQMCSMLDYLHALSPPLVHQDFTPDNLLLTSSGVLKLVDFNVAKESATTKTSLVVGKQSYMPPEQFRGKTSVQSDIYAMGATLHFLLTGADPEPLTSCRPGSVVPLIPQELDDLIARATALEPESRYQNITELQSDLQALVSTFLRPNQLPESEL